MSVWNNEKDDIKIIQCKLLMVTENMILDFCNMAVFSQGNNKNYSDKNVCMIVLRYNVSSNAYVTATNIGCFQKNTGIDSE